MAFNGSRSLALTECQGMALNSKTRPAIKHSQSVLPFVAIKGDSPIAILCPKSRVKSNKVTCP